MKVANTGMSGASAVRRRAAPRRANAAEFGAALDSARGPAAPAATQPASPLDGLLSIQEISDEPERRRRARDHGERLLANLDELRVALLGGAIPPSKLNTLLETAREQKEQVSDPRLAEILSEIELRAAVELAKLGQKF